MTLIRTVIIDDEPDSIKLLQTELNQNCPQVEIIGTYTNSTKALKDLESLSFDLLFLDIEMPEINGFELLEKVLHVDFSVVFVTAYNEFALKAFRFSALDYLLKPLDTQQLQEAVRKADKQHPVDPRQLELLSTQMYKREYPNKIAVPCQNGVVFIELKELIFCEANSNYTKLILTNGKTYLLSRTLREVQEVLEERNFLRVHRQYLVNLEHIKTYHKGDAAYLVMYDNSTIPVAKNQKERLVQKFGWL